MTPSVFGIPVGSRVSTTEEATCLAGLRRDDWRIVARERDIGDQTICQWLFGQREEREAKAMRAAGRLLTVKRSDPGGFVLLAKLPR